MNACWHGGVCLAGCRPREGNAVVVEGDDARDSPGAASERVGAATSRPAPQFPPAMVLVLDDARRVERNARHRVGGVPLELEDDGDDEPTRGGRVRG